MCCRRTEKGNHLNIYALAGYGKKRKVGIQDKHVTSGIPVDENLTTGNVHPSYARHRKYFILPAISLIIRPRPLSPPSPTSRLLFQNEMLDSMLEHGVSVERTDLAPTPELVMHSLGDKAPALWRLYVRSPYVVQNGLACNIVLWASQPAKEPAHNAVATPSTETGTSPDDSTNWPPAKLRKIR